MLDARIVASSTQSLALAAQSPATRTDWMVPSSHGLDLTLGTRNCSSRPNSSRTLVRFGLITHYLRVGYCSPAPLTMSALGQKQTSDDMATTSLLISVRVMAVVVMAVANFSPGQ